MFGKQKNDKPQDEFPDDKFDPNSETFHINEEELPDHPEIPKDLRFMPPAIARGSMTNAIASGRLTPTTINNLASRGDDVGRLTRFLVRGASNVAKATGGDINDIIDAGMDMARMVSEVKSEVSSRGVRNPLEFREQPAPPGGYRGGGGGGGSGGGGGLGNDLGGSGGEHFHGTLSMEPDPFISDFRTDIRQLFYIPNYQKSTEAYSRTLHCTAVNVQIPSTNSTQLGDFTYQVIQDIRNQVARNINISVSLSATLSTANLIGYFNNVLTLLGQYYAMKRYLSWSEPKPLLRNDGLYAIRSSMTATDIQRYLTAERCLAGLPIPPNMNLFCSWFYQLHTSGPHPMTAILQVDPFTMTSGVYNWNDISITTATFNNDAMINVANVLARAFPNWENPTLFTPPKLPMYDEGFLTIWRNLPFYFNGTNPSAHDVKGPTITNVSDTIAYNTFKDDLDGVAWALFGAYVSSTSGWIPSMVSPQTGNSTLNVGNYTNRYDYGTVGGVSGFYDNYTNDISLLARDETYSCNTRFGNLVNTTLVAGAARVDFVDPQTCIESARAFVDWLASWDSINVRVDKSLQNKRKPRPNRYTANKRKGS